jgi:hypothetical protein
MTTLIPKFDFKNGGTTPTGAVNRTIFEKLSEYVSVADYGADPTGVADSYQAFLDAYNADAAVINIPPGTYKISQTLFIDRGVTINGSGAEDGTGNNGQSAGVGSSVLNYTGITGACINIVGDYTEGVSNVHLSNFMIVGNGGTGNTSADGGLYIGSGTVVTKSTFKNLGIFAFNNATANKGYGVGIRNCLESVFENVYIHGCHDGFNLGFGSCTSLEFRSCFSRVNNQFGWNIRQGNGMSFYQCLTEGNLKTGLVLNPGDGQNISQLAFYSWYSEYNGVDADTYPAVQVKQTGTGVCSYVHFYSPIFYDYSTYNVGTGVWDIADIYLGNVGNISFINAGCVSINDNFIECTSGTNNCQWQGNGQAASARNITNNGILNGALKVSTGPTQAAILSAFDNVQVTDAWTTVWTIDLSTIGQLQVIGGESGKYGGTALFLVSRSALGNAGVAEITTFVGDASGYVISWQLSGNNFQLKHNQVGQTIGVDLYFLPTA